MVFIHLINLIKIFGFFFLFLLKKKKTQMKKKTGLEVHSVLECLPGMPEALGSISSTHTQKEVIANQ